MNTLYRVTNWNCCGPTLEEIGYTKVSEVSNGVAVLYYKDGKKFLTGEKAIGYWDEYTRPYEEFFEDSNKKMYLIVDEKKKEEWIKKYESDD